MCLLLFRMEELSLEVKMPEAKLNAIKFSLMTSSDMEKFSSVSIIEMRDVTNAKLGLPNGAPQCATCGFRNIRDCDGHFGVIKLAATVHNPYFIEEVVQLLNQICPGCLTLKQNGETKLKKGDGTTIQATCKYCSKDGAKLYPSIIFKMLTSPRVTLSRSKLHRNTSVMDKMSIIAEVASRVTHKSKNKVPHEILPQDFWDFLPDDNQPPQSNVTKKILSPYQVFHMLKKIDPELINQVTPRRELLFLSCLPVTPNCHRVVEMPYGHSDGPRLAFDDRTKAYKRMVDVSRRIDDYRQHPQFGVYASSAVTSRVMECLKSSKLYSRKSDGESSTSTDTYGTKWLKDIILSKRSDNAFRSVMVGDPKINLNEIGMPMDLALNLVVSEQVSSYNFETINLKCNLHLLTKEVLLVRRNGRLIFIRKANKLEIGDIAYRPLQDGDLILVNRPPSVHQHSLIALSAKILSSHSAVSINPLCCGPFQGDFDGDCLHGYVPQSLQSRVELDELVGLSGQLLNAQDGRSLVSLTHDSLTAAHQLTSSDVFLQKAEFQQLQMLCSSVSSTPMPSILKSSKSQGPLWTGKQLFGMLIPSGMNINFDEKLHIKDSEVLAFSSGSFWLQNNTSSLFSVMFEEYGCKALEFLSSSQDVLCEFLTMRGLSVSLSDFYLLSDHYSRRKLIEEVHLALDEAEEAFQIKQILLNPVSIPYLKYYDGADDLLNSYEQSDYTQVSLPIIQSSITSFKSVFNDLLKMVHQHASKDNSMMAMINSGSKGSVLKFVQQTACVGLQLPASIFPFRIPSELSCVSWNRHKSLNCEMTDGTSERMGGQNIYAVIRNSFLDGLNPLECLLHAISGRANFFSENADVPGTLTRKLMYHLRDTYVAYDGTVRSSYGQQIVQFSYNTADGMFRDHDLEGEPGAPVGSWAACSISEAAYGALDHPVNALEDSPLMNLQEVLKCRKSTKSVDHTGLLFLSKHLRKYRYGFEYASLQVKDHLERVDFSDLVDAVMILYGGSDMQKTQGNPWITHFHLSQETMKIKRLRLGFIVRELIEQYNALRKQSNNTIPSVCISNSNCSVGNECVKNCTCCITMVAQVESNSTSQLNIIKERVIPSILETLLKGFLEFKNVKVEYQQDSELVVKVGMSEHCKSGKFWAALQNACIPIMELIDWERSQPERVNDIFCSYGIDSAWKFFVESLRSTTDAIGRNIRRQHLLVVADCLSVSGQFHGLTSQGLKHQRTSLSISSPFSEACFSRPAHSFINAAKQDSVDNLSGTLDAIAWGKEPCVGTSGPFKILYSGKSLETKQNENIYDFLHNPDVQAIEKSFMDTYRQRTEKTSKQRSSFKSEDNGTITGGAISVIQEFLDAKVGIWENIIDMRTCLQNMLREYTLNEVVTEQDKSCLKEALKFHPRGYDKIGVGIREIKIGVNPGHPNLRCFIVLRNDDTTADFSYNKCVLGAANSLKPELGSHMEKILFNKAIWLHHL
ncbi:DNA-directed RNA polymerase IV subunit 1-like [Oryza brachyantha]|uniref:DNA-directed RNA polymerase IV subunit 1-like n=1 Tax=Oryza brachyantha TaxID=4533 RepID=UPI0007767934|nr:DNA-directed RNA polymerase IV subunit 1-like [Oryza brachyantha]